MKNPGPKHRSSLVPLRLFLLYAFFVGVFPTIQFWSDFGSIEAMEEDWDWVIVLSVIVSVPLVTALWIALRNVRRVPVLAGLLTLFTAFHLWTTTVACLNGLMGEPFSDPALNMEALWGYPKFFGVCAIPFLVVYLIWRFWQRKQAGGLPVH